jgi:hypothetical protein
MQRLRVEEYGCSVVEVQITADFWREEIAPATIYKKSNPDDHVDDGQPEVIANCTQDSEHAESQLEMVMMVGCCFPDSVQCLC